MRNTLVPEIGQRSASDHDGDEVCDEPRNVEAAGKDKIFGHSRSIEYSAVEEVD